MAVAYALLIYYKKIKKPAPIPTFGLVLVCFQYVYVLGYIEDLDDEVRATFLSFAWSHLRFSAIFHGEHLLEKSDIEKLYIVNNFLWISFFFACVYYTHYSHWHNL
jgi:hypothetical protein